MTSERCFFNQCTWSMETSPQGFIATAKGPGQSKGIRSSGRTSQGWEKHRKIVADAVLQAGQGKFAMDIHLAISEMSLSGSGNGVYPKIATFIGKMMNGSWVPYFSEMAMIRHQVWLPPKPKIHVRPMLQNLATYGYIYGTIPWLSMRGHWSPVHFLPCGANHFLGIWTIGSLGQMRLPIDFVRKNDVCHIAEININISTSQHLHLYSENQWKSMKINGNQWKPMEIMMGHGWPWRCCFGRCVTERISAVWGTDGMVSIISFILKPIFIWVATTFFAL